MNGQKFEEMLKGEPLPLTNRQIKAVKVAIFTTLKAYREKVEADSMAEITEMEISILSDVARRLGIPEQDRRTITGEYRDAVNYAPNAPP